MIMIETSRLFLREMGPEDFDALYAVLADSDIMQHYPYTFDEARANGMTLLREFTDDEQEQTAVYGISRADWETRNIRFLERPYEKRETARDV